MNSLISNETDVSEDLTPQPTLEERFPNARTFFRYHSLKAKLRLRDPQSYSLNYPAWALHEEVDIEWNKMDLYTAAEWAELRSRLLRGHESYLRSAEAADLFRRGCARTSWREAFEPDRRCSWGRLPSSIDLKDEVGQTYILETIPRADPNSSH